MSAIQTIENIVKKGTNKLAYIKPSTVCETRQIPEYLYHFTSAKNAETIINSGKILAKDDRSDINMVGVFMLDLENFVKNWPKLTIGNNWGSFNFFNMLFCQAVKGEERIACFRIPTKRLNKTMVIRDQNNAIKAGKAKTSDEIKHLMTIVDDADLYKIYHRNGNAIEFIHQGDIKVSQDDLVGITKIPEEFKEHVVFGKIPRKSAFDTLKYLFIKQPEAKILENL